MKVEKTLTQHNHTLHCLKKGFRKLFFNLYFWPLFILITLASFLCIPLIYALNFCFRFCTTDKAFRQGVRTYGKILLKVASPMAPVEVKYRTDRLTLPAIFVANHNSSVDPFLFGALPFENSFVTSWPFRIPFYRWVMKKAGYLPADEGWDHLVAGACDLFARGSSIIIWPEGHRSPEEELKRFRNGAFRLALETGRPVIPVYITGSGNLLPPGKRLLNPGPVELTIFPEIPPERYADTPQPHKVLRTEVREIIESAMKTTRTPEN